MEGSGCGSRVPVQSIRDSDHWEYGNRYSRHAVARSDGRIASSARDVVARQLVGQGAGIAGHAIDWRVALAAEAVAVDRGAPVADLDVPADFVAPAVVVTAFVAGATAADRAEPAAAVQCLAPALWNASVEPVGLWAADVLSAQGVPYLLGVVPVEQTRKRRSPALKRKQLCC